MGRYEEGLKLLEDERFTIETKENQARVLYVCARAYEELGLVDDAAQSIKKAEKLAPKAALPNEFSCEDDVEFTKVF